MTPPAQIHKITVAYDERQDRLDLACEDDAGRVTGLWLTQRLANRLVRALVAHLEGEVADPRMLDAIQAWEQSAAHAQQVPTAPVQSGTPVARRLVHSVDIGVTPEGLQLVFRSIDDGATALALEKAALRQWLGILYQHYRTAEWPCGEIWPEWFESAHAEALAPAGTMLH